MFTRPPRLLKSEPLETARYLLHFAVALAVTLALAGGMVLPSRIIPPLIGGSSSSPCW